MKFTSFRGEGGWGKSDDFEKQMPKKDENIPIYQIQ